MSSENIHPGFIFKEELAAHRETVADARSVIPEDMAAQAEEAADTAFMAIHSKISQRALDLLADFGIFDTKPNVEPVISGLLKHAGLTAPLIEQKLEDHPQVTQFGSARRKFITALLRFRTLGVMDSAASTIRNDEREIQRTCDRAGITRAQYDREMQEFLEAWASA